MTKSIQDIIPTPFAPPQQRTPIDILRSLAHLLGKQTNEKVIGDVRTVALNDKLVHSFRARVPSLSNYTLELFRVAQSPIELYPVQISSEFSPVSHPAEDDEKLIELLTDLFRTDALRDAISTLLAQAE